MTSYYFVLLVPLSILKPEEQVGIEAVYKKEFFNLRASDKISLWRSLPDYRNQE